MNYRQHYTRPITSAREAVVWIISGSGAGNG